MPRVQCQACLYWEPIEPVGEGSCHRHAPVPYFGLKSERRTGFVQQTAWPKTMSSDGCGDGEIKGKPDP
jgi:hypothetical protein